MDVFGIPGELVGLLLGWMLGLFSPIIAARFQRARDVKELVAAIRAELAELRITMTLLAQDLQRRVGPADDAFLDWVIASLDDLTGSDPEMPQYLDHVKAIRVLPAAQRPHRPPDPNEATLLKKYSLPFLEANLTRLGICPVPFQQSVINIKRTLDNFNGDADLIMSYFEKTFNPSLGINREVVQSNLDRAYVKALKAAKNVADQIGRILAKGD